MKTAIYVRVSTTHQIDKDSLPMQKQDLIYYNEHIIGNQEYEIFEDAGYSGKDTDRPAFQDMLKRLRKHEFSHVLVWKLDRVSRNLLDFAQLYKELKSLGVTFISKNEQFDTSSAIGEAMLKIILVFAELERNMTSERVIATMVSRANNGIWNGGRIPYGYDYIKEEKRFVLNEKEANIVRLLYNKYLEGGTLISLSRYMNEHGYTTRSGNEWNPASIHIILTNIFYTGSYRYNMYATSSRILKKPETEWVVVPNHHEAIITEELFKATQDRLHSLDKGMYYAPKDPSKHLFNKKLICKACGTILSSGKGAPNKAGVSYSYYICPRKRKASAEQCACTSDVTVGEFVLNYIIHLINASKQIDNFGNLSEFQNYLLEGACFDYIESISPIEEIFSSLNRTGISSIKINIPDSSNAESTDKLREKLNTTNRAIKRLDELYLFDDTALPKETYVANRTELLEISESLQNELDQLESKNKLLSDDDFVSTASSALFMLTITNRNYANFKKLYRVCDRKILSKFIDSSIESIVIDGKKVQSITFSNGLTHTFNFKNT